MTLVEKLRLNTNYEAFSNGPVKYLGYITMTMNLKRSLALRIFHKISLTNSIAHLLMLIAYVVVGCGTLQDRYAAIIFANYYLVALGKHITVAHFRLAIKGALEDFRRLSPSIQQVRQYGLQNYLRNYRYVERLIYNFFVYICALYSIQPVIMSFIALWVNGEFGFQLALPVWPSLTDYLGYLGYAIHAFFNAWSSWLIGFSIVSSDVTLLSFLSQLCAHFDLITQRILELKPDNEDSLQILNSIIREHQQVVRLTKKVNKIFAPSIACTLSSSSFIICFVAYQMLDDVALVEAVMAFLLLCYELKQVILICYYGDKLIEMSGQVFDAIYMHEWYNGSLKYRRQIIFLLLATRHPVAIKIAGTVNVSLITLKQVFSNAYQIFAVLKTA